MQILLSETMHNMIVQMMMNQEKEVLPKKLITEIRKRLQNKYKTLIIKAWFNINKNFLIKV